MRSFDMPRETGSHRLMFSRLMALAIGLLAIGTSTAIADVSLVKNGKTQWQIVSPSRDGSNTEWAAAELQKYLLQISDCKLPIGTQERRFKPAIIVGLRDSLSEKDQKLLPPRKEGFDGFAIAISEKPERIVIAGDNVPGTVYGVYEFLEHLGCRWFYPTEDPKDPEVVPKNTTVTLAPKSWNMASPVRYRICNGSAWYFKMDHEAAKRQIDWGMKARYNMMGWQSENKVPLLPQYQAFAKSGILDELKKRGMSIHGPAHCFDQFLSDELHFEKHPEWFGVRDGKRSRQTFAGAQFCWSNPEARNEFTRNVEAFAVATPLIKILCIVPFDGGKACQCSECTKIGASSALMTLMREVIDRVGKVRPDLLIETVGGYEPMTTPPTGVEIHPKQRIAWAHWGRYHKSGYDDPSYDRKENLELWRKASPAGITLVQYYTDNFAEPWVMGPFTAAIESDRKYFLRNKIDSIYMLMYPFGYWWNHSFNGYLAGRCFYDVSTDPMREVREYALKYYGCDAGPFMAEYHTEWAGDIELSYRVRGGSTKEDRATLRRQREQFVQKAIDATKDQPLFRYRVGKAERLHAIAERLTEVSRQRDLVLWMRKDGKFDEASTLLKKAKPYTDEVMDFLFASADLNQGLIEKKEIPSFIKARVQGWIEEETKKVEAKDRTVKIDFFNRLNEAEMLPADLTQ